MKTVTIALIIFFASFLYADAKRKGYAKQVQNQLVELLNHKEFVSFEKQLKDAEEHGYIQEYNLVVSEREFDNFLFIDFGGRREYFLNYFEKPLNDSIDELVFLLNGILPRLLGIDQHSVTTLLFKGIQIAKTIDCNQIRFL